MDKLEITLKIIAENIRNRRAILKINQDELAFRANMHRAYVGRVERAEKNLTLSTIFKFAEALNCYIIDLITHDKKIQQ